MLVPWITLAWSLATSHRSATTSNLLKIKTTKSNCACSKIYLNLNHLRFGSVLFDSDSISIGQLTPVYAEKKQVNVLSSMSSTLSDQLEAGCEKIQFFDGKVESNN